MNNDKNYGKLENKTLLSKKVVIKGLLTFIGDKVYNTVITIYI